MGVEKEPTLPPLTLPTESEETTTATETIRSEGSGTVDEVSHYSLPDDGTPVTIRTRGHRSDRSQTSLLIEYFEGGKTTPSGPMVTERKPSVRVRLTPSKTRGKNDHIQITETRSSGRSSSSKGLIEGSHLSRGELDATDPEDAHSMHSYASATEESNVSRNPIEVEIDPGSGQARRRRKASSPLIPAADAKGSKSSTLLPRMSGISEAQRDLLDESNRDELVAKVAVESNVDSMSRVRSETHDQNDDRKSSRSERKQRSKSRASSVAEKDVDNRHSSRRVSRGTPRESTVSVTEPSVLPQLTPSHRSFDSHASSKISINNPKLLETVEDAIRRLILPELDAIKRERSQRVVGRNKDRDSVSSLTSVSREDISIVDKRRTAETSSVIKLRDREARNDLSTHSSIDQFSYTEDIDDDNSTSRRTRDMQLDEALGSVTGSSLRSKSRVDEKRQRRRRRVETSKRDHTDADEDEAGHRVVPPMPLSSEINFNASELTRTSILSVQTDRPQSASEQKAPAGKGLHDVTSVESMNDAATPIRSPVNTLQALGTQHNNISRGDLRALPRKGPAQYTEQYEEEGYGVKYPSQPQDAYNDDDYDEQGHLEESGVYEDDSAFYGSQDVPAPLRYVPYSLQDRGLSPIQSVSGYTEGDSEVQGHRDAKPAPTNSELSTFSKSPYDRDIRSRNSIPSNLRSEDANSALSSALGYRNTVYTDNSEVGPVTSAQAVKVIEGNPRMVHQSFGPESAVASLVDPSMLSGSPGGGLDHTRDSQVSYNESVIEPLGRGISPAKRAVEPAEQTPHSPSPSRENEGSTSSHQFDEYELNEYGQKVPRSTQRQSPTTSESAITAAALSRAAAAALKRQNQGNESPSNELDEEFVPEGISRNRSFKERAKDNYRPDATPRHSVDRLYDHDQPKMGSNGIPNPHHPEPEIGYGYDYDDLSERRTPSATDERFAEADQDYTTEWAGRTTPTQEAHDSDLATTPKADQRSGHGLADDDDAAADQDPDEEWQRTSADRKRDTLLTNPYEGASPIDNLPGIDGNIIHVAGASAYGSETYRNGFQTSSPGLAGGDEGYISAAPNEVRECMQLGNKTFNNLDDSFYGTRDLRLSGMSQGMQTPLFDSATGVGIDRIQSKDIIALMEHLMVRDAQRSARDTEILVTLVRSAAEMRNSFDDIKKMLAETEGNIVNDVNANTENSIKRHLGGPRPFPGSSARSIQGGSQTGTDERARKRNLLRRALQGLSAKGTNDLSRIEDMLIQLLTDVDVLKHQTAVPGGTMSPRTQSIGNSRPELSYEQDRGYEPEGNAGTSTGSHASHSGHLSIPQSRGVSMRTASERKLSDHRVSTVQEDDGEYEQSTGISRNLPSRDDMVSPLSDGNRGGSAPLGTPPQSAHSQQARTSFEDTSLSPENKRHRAKGSSSFFPKISRWSETTASSIGKAFRTSGNSRKQTTSEGFVVNQPLSRSGSDLASFDPYQQQSPYADDKLHIGFSTTDLVSQGDGRDSPRLTQQSNSPTTYDAPEDPKYRAHRDSLNLQHPQPRQGQTQRFRTALESSAANFDSPMSPKSADWAGSVTSLSRFTQQNSSRFSNNGETNTAAGADEYNWPRTSSPASQAPARPPKEPLDSQSQGTSTPLADSGANRQTKNQPSPLSHQSADNGYGTATAAHIGSYKSGSPRLENKNLSAALGVPTRRPSGPRAMTPSRSDDSEREDRRRKRDTFSTAARPSSALSQASESF